MSVAWLIAQPTLPLSTDADSVDDSTQTDNVATVAECAYLCRFSVRLAALLLLASVPLLDPR